MFKESHNWETAVCDQRQKLLNTLFSYIGGAVANHIWYLVWVQSDHSAKLDVFWLPRLFVFITVAKVGFKECREVAVLNSTISATMMSLLFQGRDIWQLSNKAFHKTR